MLLHTKLHGKTYELLETGSLDMPSPALACRCKCRNNRSGLLDYRVKMNLSSFL